MWGEALKYYQDSRSLAETLTKSDPSNTDRRHDLAISYLRTAIIFLRASRPGEMLDAIAKDRSVMAGLLAEHPDNTKWRQDLATFDKLIAAQKKLTSEAKPARPAKQGKAKKSRSAY